MNNACVSNGPFTKSAGFAKSVFIHCSAAACGAAMALTSMNDMDQLETAPTSCRRPSAVLTKRTQRASVSFTTCRNALSNSGALIAPAISRYSARLYAGLDGSIV